MNCLGLQVYVACIDWACTIIGAVTPAPEPNPPGIPCLALISWLALLRWALLWALWHIGNKITIEGVFPSHPTDRIFKCILDGEALELGLQRLQPINSNARTPQVAA